VDGACKELVPLLKSGTAGLSAAVRSDLANILVDHGDASDAQHWLTEYTIRDSGLLDLLAATYVDLDRDADGYQMNRVALDFDYHASAATLCHRQARRYLLGDREDQEAARTALTHLGTGKVPDPTCVALRNAIFCGEEHDCVGYLKAQGVDIRAQKLLIAY